ncbi:right-handed parallel beta-helix repeat-containing protein [Lyngbya confervoides]|uniref:Right-handed parallel beta-helix repeat-containing protein n=1 Tax=Lyngbya confervoides BDU141951 TaxID=1574623 RepID=A0ABD4T582_9CYAN|nr:right-handed parallel beta-helix repeat-containing protein [Lyngbya confervoides]MCM1983677.1 right-handed parallel beta-helix repeat-containing protein [Lyngbya confervoides BDU141951]
MIRPPFRTPSPLPAALNLHELWGWLGLGLVLGLGGIIGRAQPARSLAPFPQFTLTVNSAQDGEIQPDDQLTLREAIALANGTLPRTALSPAEAAQVQDRSSGSRIVFDLPPQHTTIRLQTLLPAIAAPDLVIDGTTQGGYEPGNPVVSLQPQAGVEVLRGLTLTADRLQVRGLHLSGFRALHRQSFALPSASILVTHHPQAESLGGPWRAEDRPGPQHIVIADNVIGPATPGGDALGAAFGIWIYEARHLTIANNQLQNHRGSAIVTSHWATDTRIEKNQIRGNGARGMPDAVRLEGQIGGTQILGNQLLENAGSAVFLFKTSGAIAVQDNRILGNGTEIPRAALYLMGNDHQIRQNYIGDQNGPGVVIAAYPQSRRNIIVDNQFRNLKGLSIDLVTRRHTTVRDYQVGDGPNPRTESTKRHLDTANRGISAPEFLSREFSVVGGGVSLEGVAMPGATVSLYRVQQDESSSVFQQRGPLSQRVAQTTVDQTGRFDFFLSEAELGAQLSDQLSDQASAQFSVIATHPDYGTSEPARNVTVRSRGVSRNPE